VKAPTPILTNALLGLVCLVWGSTWLVIKVGLRDVPPFTGAAVRFVIAGLCMAALVALFSRREGGGSPPRGVVLAQGLFQFALNYGLVYVAETAIPSGLVAVLWSVFPLFVSLAGHFVLRSEILSPAQWFGLVLAFGGVALLFVTDLLAIDLRAVKLGLLLLLAPLSVTVSTLLIKYRAAGASSLILNRDSMLIGAVVLGGIAAALERGQDPRWTSLAVGSILYLALAGTVLTFGVYLWLLRYVPAYKMSLTAFVTPLLALLLGSLVGGEPLSVFTLLGSGCVIGGVALVLVAKARQLGVK
jgi:drug/metabolite transporter (DMT)-like permease